MTKLVIKHPCLGRLFQCINLCNKAPMWGRISIEWWKIVSQASFGKSKNPISTFPLSISTHAWAVGLFLPGWLRRWCSKIPLVWCIYIYISMWAKPCVSWKLEITPKTETYHFLFITAWVDDPHLSSFKPFFLQTIFSLIANTQLWSLWSESSQKKSVCETCPNRFCQDDSIQIWNFTNCQFQDMKTYMTLILEKKT